MLQRGSACGSVRSEGITKMTSDLGMTYSFAMPNPAVRILRESIVAGIVIGTCVVLGFWLGGFLPVLVFLLGEILLVVMAVALLQWGTHEFKRGAVVVIPDHLVIKHWMSRQKIPWQDVASVKVERYEPSSPLSRFFASVLYGPDGDVPHVKIALRWSILYSFWKTGVPGMRSFSVYLQDPGTFAREVQQFLTTSSV
jgi:hypothetical protein